VARIIVDVMPKSEILDPQGKAVHGALPRLGFTRVSDVRQGKRFELQVESADDATLAEVERIAETLLSNPVIEDFTVRVDDEPTASSPEPTTSAPEPTTSSPEPTTSSPEPTTSSPEPTTSAPEPTASSPEPTTSSPEPTASAPEPTTSSPEPVEGPDEVVEEDPA
jgi:phosphoribosylformylglycinamidine synthase PurS subunit